MGRGRVSNPYKHVCEFKSVRGDECVHISECVQECMRV